MAPQAAVIYGSMTAKYVTWEPATDLYALGATMYHCIIHAEVVPAVDRAAALRKGQSDPLGFRVGNLPYSEGS